MDKYLKSKYATKELNVTENTLRRWSKIGKIDIILTPGGQRLYNVDKFLVDSGIKEPEIIKNKENIRKKICYCRVSTRGQKNDLTRQIALMEKLYPDYEIIKDIGSGINFKRVGLLKLIDYAMENKLEEVVVAYKDRLCRFGFDLIEYIITTYSNGKIVIINDKNNSPEEEIVNDLVQIINVFSAKINGSRKYKKKSETEESDIS